MNDPERFIKRIQKEGPGFAADYEADHDHFKIGVMLQRAGETAGVIQKESAQKPDTHKSAISRIEHRAEDIWLSTLECCTRASGKKGAGVEVIYNLKTVSILPRLSGSPQNLPQSFRTPRITLSSPGGLGSPFDPTIIQSLRHPITRIVIPHLDKSSINLVYIHLELWLLNYFRDHM